MEDVELATLAWVHWWNTTRLHSAIGNVLPVEFVGHRGTHPSFIRCDNGPGTGEPVREGRPITTGLAPLTALAGSS